MQFSKQFMSKIFLGVSAVVGMQGCNLTPTTEVKAEEENNIVVVEKKVYEAEPGLAPKQRFTKALGHLEVGETEMALAELNAYKVDIPNSTIVSKLLKQINTPSDVYYPEDFYTVELKSGTSLSTLSEKYLGSALDFFALAKYNGVKNARQVLIGQEIKIPKTQLARTVWEREENAGTSEDSLDSEAEDIADTEEALPAEDAVTPEEALEASEIEAQLLASQKAMTPEMIIQEVEVFNASGDYESAISNISKLLSLGGDPVAAESLIIESYTGYADNNVNSNPELASERYASVADIYARRGDEVEQYLYMSKAAEVDTQNSALIERTNLMKQTLVEKYHRQASSEFRRQELDPAIAHWDIVLRIDPTHDNAKVFRARAIELKERLQKISEESS
jgi:tetratricopeptide (TPR) repeat protein